MELLPQLSSPTQAAATLQRPASAPLVLLVEGQEAAREVEGLPCPHAEGREVTLQPAAQPRQVAICQATCIRLVSQGLVTYS